MSVSYTEKLKHPKWQKIRLQVFERDGFRCRWCGDENSTLHVHHERYHGKNPWDTPIDQLKTLCEDCHFIEHLNLTDLEKILINEIRNSNKGNTEYMQFVNYLIRSIKA